jgi:phosphoglycerate kinase
MKKQTVYDIDTRPSIAFLRVDYNVPLDRTTNEIVDDTRIRATIPTIRYLQNMGTKTILCSHLGRPKGQVVPSLTMSQVAHRLERMLGEPVRLLNSFSGSSIRNEVNKLSAQGIAMLENIRFRPEEEANDAPFAQQLSECAEIYVNDAFGTAHRSHASTVGITRHLPAVAGLLLKHEVEMLEQITLDPKRPTAVLVGGAKLSDKIGIIENLMHKIDQLLIGGGMAAPFLRAKGYGVGQSSHDGDQVKIATALLERSKASNMEIILPVDVVIADGFSNNAATRIVPTSDIDNDWILMDIGPKTVALFDAHLQTAKTVMWNGPMGVAEFSNFAKGTSEIANRLSLRSQGISIAGGGSTSQMIHDLGLSSSYTHVSTGGGASLEFLKGKDLPAIKALLDKN